MIADECEKLRLQLEEVEQAKGRKHIVEQLGHRQQDLKALRDKVLAVTNSLSAIHSVANLEGDLDISTATERLQNIRQALESDPISITEGRNFSYMRKAFEKFADEGELIAKETWDIYRRTAQPTIDKNQLAQAMGQASFKQLASDIEQNDKDLGRRAKKPPKTKEDLDSIEEGWEEIRQMISGLPEVASDPKVQDFIIAANTKDGAPLEMLTDEVSDWLNENNMSAKYRIYSK